MKLNQLEERVLELCQKIEYLKKENIMLIEENVKIKQDTERVKLGNIAFGQGPKSPVSFEENTAEKEQLRKELDKYIVEVDKCIELINDM